jgi:hypothetical protein
VGEVDLRDLLLDLRRNLRSVWSSRTTWVWVGDIAQWFAAVGAVWYMWSSGPTLASGAVALVACVLCQAVAVAAVVVPGREAGSHRLMDHHQGVTVGVLCLSGIFGLALGLPVLYKTLDEPEHPTAAVFVAGMAFLLTSVAGLIAVTALSSRATAGSAERLPDEPDWVDAVDVVDAGTADD